MTRLSWPPVITGPGVPLSGAPGAGSLVGGITKAGVRAALSAITEWVAGGAAGLVRSVASFVARGTSPDLGSVVFGAHFKVVAGIAALLVIPLLMLSVISAIVRQDPAVLVRTVAVLPLAALATAAAVEVVSLALAATDELCNMVITGAGIPPAAFLGGLGASVEQAPHLSTAGEFGVIVVAVVLAMAAFGLAIELVMRTAAVYVAVLFLPLALAGMVWPATSHWARRLLELLAVLILSKFVVVAVISLGASALVNGANAIDPSGIIGGAALLIVSAFAPFALLRLVPAVEAGAVGHLEGVGRRLVPPSPLLHRPGPLPDGPPAPERVGPADYPADSPGASQGRRNVAWDLVEAAAGAGASATTEVARVMHG